MSAKKKIADEVKTKIKTKKKVFKETQPLKKEPIKKVVSAIKEMPQRACVDCHFLAERCDETSNIDVALEINYKIFYHYVEDDNREKIRETPSSFLYFKNLCCKSRVWRCRNDEERQRMEVIGEDRIKCYLYYPYKEGMSFEAGKEIRDKEQNNKIESVVNSVAGTKVSKKPKAKKATKKKGELNRDGKQNYVPREKLNKFLKKELKRLKSAEGGELRGGTLRKKLMKNITKEFKKEDEEGEIYTESYVRNLISEINTGKI
jgi:hypothetical protein